MSTYLELLPAVDIADGQAVNWTLLDSQAQDDDDRKQLRMLRILEEIAQLHRSTMDGDSEADESFADASRSSVESYAASSAESSVETLASRSDVTADPRKRIRELADAL